MELRPHITGIVGRSDPLSTPCADRKAFHSHCYVAARATGAKVLDIEDPAEVFKMCNYVIARFEFSNVTVAVLLNTTYPIIAFAKCPISDSQNVFEYIDCPRLADAFRSLGEYTVATAVELNQPLLREMCKDMTPTEQKRVRYFRPTKVGDVIFNYWD